MSRHRNIRKLDYSDDYSFDDVYGKSLDEDVAVSPSTEAQFLYHRDSREAPSLRSFFDAKDNPQQQQQQQSPAGQTGQTSFQNERSPLAYCSSNASSLSSAEKQAKPLKPPPGFAPLSSASTASTARIQDALHSVNTHTHHAHVTNPSLRPPTTCPPQTLRTRPPSTSGAPNLTQLAGLSAPPPPSTSNAPSLSQLAGLSAPPPPSASNAPSLSQLAGLSAPPLPPSINNAPSLSQLTGLSAPPLPSSINNAPSLSQLAGLSAKSSQSSGDCFEDTTPRVCSKGPSLSDLLGGPTSVTQGQGGLLTGDGLKGGPSLSRLAGKSVGRPPILSCSSQHSGPNLSTVAGLSTVSAVSTGPSLASLAGLSTVSAVSTGSSLASLAGLSTVSAVSTGPSLASLAGCVASTDFNPLTSGVSNEPTLGTTSPFSSSQATLSSLAQTNTHSSIIQSKSRASELQISNPGAPTQPSLTDLARFHALCLSQQDHASRNSTTTGITVTASNETHSNSLAKTPTLGLPMQGLPSTVPNLSNSGSTSGNAPTLSDLAALARGTAMQPSVDLQALGKPTSLSDLAALSGIQNGLSHDRDRLNRVPMIGGPRENAVQFQKQSPEDLRKPNYFALVLSGSLRKTKSGRVSLESRLANLRATVLRKMARDFVKQRTRRFDFTDPSPDDIVRKNQKEAGFGKK